MAKPRIKDDLHLSSQSAIMWLSWINAASMWHWPGNVLISWTVPGLGVPKLVESNIHLRLQRQRGPSRKAQEILDSRYAENPTTWVSGTRLTWLLLFVRTVVVYDCLAGCPAEATLDGQQTCMPLKPIHAGWVCIVLSFYDIFSKRIVINCLNKIKISLIDLYSWITQ